MDSLGEQAAESKTCDHLQYGSILDRDATGRDLSQQDKMQHTSAESEAPSDLSSSCSSSIVFFTSCQHPNMIYEGYQHVEHVSVSGSHSK